MVPIKITEGKKMNEFKIATPPLEVRAEKTRVSTKEFKEKLHTIFEPRIRLSLEELPCVMTERMEVQIVTSDIDCLTRRVGQFTSEEDVIEMADSVLTILHHHRLETDVWSREISLDLSDRSSGKIITRVETVKERK